MKQGAEGAASTLDWLLGPMTRETFFADHYGQAPLLLPRSEPQRYSHLLTLEALDAFVASADLRHDMLRLVAGGDALDPARYVAPDGRVLPTAVAEAYSRGATIILPQLHLSLAPLSDFCRAIEADFSASVQANAYLTPGRERGFVPHYDQHDVFILQVAGTKRWTLYDRPAHAGGGAPFVRDAHEPGRVSGQHLLAVGDCLYIPRGLMHEATSEGDAPSLHLTIGILAKRWGDVILDAVAALVRDDPAFHGSLPPGYATDPEAFRAALQDSRRCWHESPGARGSMRH